MKKEQKEYIEKYAYIPNDTNGRFDYVMNLGRSNGKTQILNTIDKIRSIKWKKHSFVIYVVPKGTPRPRSGKNGVFYVKGAKDNHKLFKEFAESVGGFDLITTACKFDCRVYLPIPSSMKLPEKVLAEMGFIRPISKPDWDNLGKAYCDMIQSTLLYDDASVIDGRTRKYYSCKPRVEIDLEYAEEFDSDFNKKKIERKVK